MSRMLKALQQLSDQTSADSCAVVPFSEEELAELERRSIIAPHPAEDAGPSAEQGEAEKSTSLVSEPAAAEDAPDPYETNSPSWSTERADLLLSAKSPAAPVEEPADAYDEQRRREEEPPATPQAPELEPHPLASFGKSQLDTTDASARQAPPTALAEANTAAVDREQASAADTPEASGPKPEIREGISFAEQADLSAEEIATLAGQAEPEASPARNSDPRPIAEPPSPVFSAPVPAELEVARENDGGSEQAEDLRHAEFKTNPISAPRSEFARIDVPEEYQRLREGILALAANRQPLAIALTSVLPWPDRRAVLATLAKSFVGLFSGEVLIVDAAFDGGGWSDELGVVPSGHQIDTSLELWQPAECCLQTHTPGLVFLPLGEQRQRGALFRQAAAEPSIAERCKRSFPVVLLDVGPVDSGQAIPFGRGCDATCLAIDLATTERQKALRAIDHLQRDGIKSIGCVLLEPHSSEFG